MNPRKLIATLVLAVTVIGVSLYGQYRAADINEQLRGQVEVLQQNNEMLSIALQRCNNECVERIINNGDTPESKAIRRNPHHHSVPPNGFMWPGNDPDGTRGSHIRPE